MSDGRAAREVTAPPPPPLPSRTRSISSGRSRSVSPSPGNELGVTTEILVDNEPLQIFRGPGEGDYEEEVRRPAPASSRANTRRLHIAPLSQKISKSPLTTVLRRTHFTPGRWSDDRCGYL
jgi:hypothetical protein